MDIAVEHVTIGPPTDGLPGFCEREVTLAPQARRPTIAALLAALPVGRGLGYFDIRMPSPSDPGAYVFVWRADDGHRLAYGNHGWSTYAQRIDADDATTHLWTCLRQLPGRDAPPLALTHADFSWKLRPAPWYLRLLGAKPRVDPAPRPAFQERLASIRAAEA